MRNQNKADWTVGRRLQQIDNVAVKERIKYLVSLQRLGGIVKETKFFFWICSLILFSHLLVSFSKWYLSFWFFHQSPVCSSPLPSSYVPHAHEFHSPSFDHTNDICWGADLMRLPILQFSVVLLLPHPSSTQMSSSEPYSRTPWACLLPQCETPSFILI